MGCGPSRERVLVLQDEAETKTAPATHCVDARPDRRGPPKRWKRGQLIGAGSYGKVYMAMDGVTGELMAVKEIVFTANNAAAELEAACGEIDLLRSLDHPNIVRYIGTSAETANTLFIFMEWVPGGRCAARSSLPLLPPPRCSSARVRWPGIRIPPRPPAPPPRGRAV